MKITIILEDSFSGCLDKRIKKFTEKKQFEKAKNWCAGKIGKFLNEFDKKQQIAYTWIIKNIIIEG